MAGPFNPNLGQAPVSGKAPVEQNVKGVGDALASSAGNALDILGQLKERSDKRAKNRAEAEAQAEAGEALTEFQTQLLNQQNSVIKARATEADLVQRGASVRQQNIQNPNEDGEGKLEQVRQKNKQFLEARAQGRLTDAGVRIRQNNLLKEALNDPRLRGFQDEVNKIFGKFSEVEFDPVDSVLTADDKQRLGPNPSPGRISSLLAEKRITANIEFEQQLGEASFNRLNTQITPLAQTETKKVRDMAAEIFDQQGAITQNQQDQLNALLLNTKDQLLQKVDNAVAKARENGRRISADEQEALRNRVTEQVSNTRDFITDKDLQKKLKKMIETENAIMRALIPGGLGAINSIGKGGTIQDISTANQILNMTDQELEGVVGDNAGLVQQLQEQALKVQELTVQGVEIPGQERLQSFVSGLAIENGTNTEATKVGIDVFSKAEDKESIEATLRHFNKSGSVRTIRSKKEEVRPRLNNLAKNYARSLQARAGREIRFRRKEDGTIDLLESGRSGSSNPLESSIATQFNKFLSNYSDVIDVEAILKLFEEVNTNNSN